MASNLDELVRLGLKTMVQFMPSTENKAGANEADNPNITPPSQSTNSESVATMPSTTTNELGYITPAPAKAPPPLPLAEETKAVPPASATSLDAPIFPDVKSVSTIAPVSPASPDTAIYPDEMPSLPPALVRQNSYMRIRPTTIIPYRPQHGSPEIFSSLIADNNHGSRN